MMYNESQVVAFAQDCVALTTDVGRVGVQCARMQHDAETMGYAASRAKHLNELRIELGLPPNPNPPSALLLPLRVDGFYLANDSGRWFGIGASSFLAYYRFLTEGPDALRPVFQQLKDLGFNLIRVFGMVDSFAHWYPQEHADYFPRIPDFLDFAESYGFYVLWDAFADTGIVMSDGGQQATYWGHTIDALKQRTNALVSVGNELDVHSNNIAFDPPRPSGILASRGSFGGQPQTTIPMPTPDWDFGCFHVRRDYPKTIPDVTTVQLRTGDTSDHVAHPIPIGQDEPPHFAEAPGPHGYWTNPDWARELSGTAKGTSAFVIFHCDADLLSQLLGPNQTIQAAAFVAGGR